MVILSAEVSGLPQPAMEWTHNGKPLKMASNISVDTVAEASTITIKGSAAKNGGKYTLTAHNEIGTDTADFAVTVTGKNHCYLLMQYVINLCVDFKGASNISEMLGIVLQLRLNAILNYLPSCS